MFKIDLLKGQGIPVRSRPTGIAVSVLTFAVPIVAAIAMFSYYLHARIVTSVYRQQIAGYETKINELADVVELQKLYEKETKAINTSLSEVKSALSRHTQWSPVLETLANIMPDSLMLTKLEAKETSARVKVPKKNDPKKHVQITVPSRSLHMTLCASSESNRDKALRDFRHRLQFSSELGKKISNMRVSQHFDTLYNNEVVCYDIDCVFKPEF